MDSRSSNISGRPHGDVAILYKKVLGNNVSKVDTKSKRICALRRIKWHYCCLSLYAMRHTKCVTMCRWISRCHAGFGDIVEWSWWCSCCNLWRLEYWSFSKKMHNLNISMHSRPVTTLSVGIIRYQSETIHMWTMGYNTGHALIIL